MTKKEFMNIVFFGSSKYSVIVAKALQDAFGLSAVVTLPDRIGNRNKIVKSPVKEFADENGIPAITPDTFDSAAIVELNNIGAQFFVVADYGKILKEQVLCIPTKASINVHHSLLPKYRGTSPAPTAILNGDLVSGVTVIKMNAKMDAGDILAQEKYKLTADETTDSLLTKLNTIGGKLAVSVIQDYDSITPRIQIEQEATFTKKMKKEDGYIDSENPPAAEQLDRMIRAYFPWPGVWTRLQIANGVSRMVKLLPMKMIQPEGKNPMSYKDFLNGYPDTKGFIEKISY
jgi:methionyl-tRNA formyltransferase